MARESDARAVANMIEEVISKAEERDGLETLSSFEVTRFIRAEFQKRYNKWQGLDV